MRDRYTYECNDKYVQKRKKKKNKARINMYMFVYIYILHTKQSSRICQIRLCLDNEAQTQV